MAASSTKYYVVQRKLEQTSEVVRCSTSNKKLFDCYQMETVFEPKLEVENRR